MWAWKAKTRPDWWKTLGFVIVLWVCGLVVIVFGPNSTRQIRVIPRIRGSIKLTIEKITICSRKKSERDGVGLDFIFSALKNLCLPTISSRVSVRVYTTVDLHMQLSVALSCCKFQCKFNLSILKLSRFAMQKEVEGGSSCARSEN